MYTGQRSVIQGCNLCVFHMIGYSGSIVGTDCYRLHKFAQIITTVYCVLRIIRVHSISGAAITLRETGLQYDT